MAVVALSVFATSYGFRDRQARFFWPVAEAIFGALAVFLVAAKVSAPSMMNTLGLSGGQWFVAFALRRLRDDRDGHADAPRWG